MKKVFTIFIALFFLSQLCFGQITDAEKKLREAKFDSTSSWKKGAILGLNLSQAAFVNWSAGGENSIAVNGIVSIFANYLDDQSEWGNMLDIGYGVIKQGKKGHMMKSDDRIDFTSKYGRLITKNLYYAAILNFKTQMTPGYNYPNDSVSISDFLAPGYIIGALGFDYKPDENYSAFVAPVTSRITIVHNTNLADSGAFGVERATFDNNGNLLKHGKTIRSEFGGYARFVYKNNFFEDKSVSVLSKLDLFTNYLHKPQNIDVNWETIFGFKVNKYIVATISFNVIYDDDTRIAIINDNGIIEGYGPRTQFKDVIAIGFSYKF